MNYSNRKFNMMSAYEETKLYNLLLVKSLNYIIKMKGDKDIIKAVAVNPGVSNTDLYRYKSSQRPFMFCWKSLICRFKSAENAAQTYLHCALIDWEKLECGGYYEECKLSKPSELANSEEQMQL